MTIDGVHLLHLRRDLDLELVGVHHYHDVIVHHIEIELRVSKVVAIGRP